ncbi:unnamed protein product [Paramecium sonneborni]|uniref:WD40-repeat-containing domain n=1 Tax=Paramecium sonneborni TaxID=65129 RepID=A0A8S1MPG1_9CILI|nr:unnamed protein product [Paramecium sonneborni]CAD8076804.1 unnamed protein product [Paramecium sonneborni]
MDQIKVKHSPINQFQISDKEFPLSLQFINDTVLMAMTDFSLKWIDLNTQQVIWEQKNHHQKRIQQLIVENNVAFTCSNDRTIKVLDLQSKQQIHQFKNEKEFFSIAKSKHILAGGSDGRIDFYDLNVMKWRSRFDSSQNEELSSLNFHPQCQTQLLSSSTDGLLVQYDLTQKNEEESLQMMIRFDQPLNSCGYWNNLCFCVTTTNQITILDQQNDQKLYQFQAIKNDEFHEDYLIDVMADHEFKYYVGNGKDIYQKNEKQQIVALYGTNSTEQIRHIKQFKDCYLLFSENGLLEILKPQQFVYQAQSIEQEALDLIEEEDNEKKQKKTR